MDNDDLALPPGMLLPLDDAPGPAAPLAPAQAALLLAAVMEPGRRAARPSWHRAAAAAVLLLVVGAASAAIYRAFSSTTPSAVPPSAPAAPAPAPPPAPSAPPPPHTAAPPPLRPSPPRSASAPRTPEDLLDLANERRRTQRWEEADALYQRVLRAHPRTSAAYVARVASAALHLEQLRDARGAARLYEAAVRERPRGSLAEEALRGLAEARRALGDRDGERRALRQLLTAAPSPAARRFATDRLRALEEVPAP